MKAWIRNWAPAIVIMLLIFIASSTPGNDLPGFGVWDFSVKKGGHILGYALLAIACFHALDKTRLSSSLRFTLAIFFAILYAVSDEWHQKFTPGRSSAFSDVCIDAAGAFLGLALYRFIRSRRSNPEKVST